MLQRKINLKRKIYNKLNTEKKKAIKKKLCAFMHFLVYLFVVLQLYYLEYMNKAQKNIIRDTNHLYILRLEYYKHTRGVVVEPFDYFLCAHLFIANNPFVQTHSTAPAHVDQKSSAKEGKVEEGRKKKREGVYRKERGKGCLGVWAGRFWLLQRDPHLRRPNLA